MFELVFRADQAFLAALERNTNALRENTRSNYFLARQEMRLMTAIDDLETAVAENTTVDSSAVALIEGLAKKIDELKTDPAKLAALATSLRASSAAMAAAITANTQPPDAPPADTPQT